MDSSNTRASMGPNDTVGGQLEIGHVLFIDLVGYSKLLTDEQREQLQELNRVVRETEQFRSADATGKLLRLPTGDGMVLVFFTTPDAPARCAIAISRALGRNSNVPLRMGIHSGPVEKIAHVDDRPNLAGAGINMAQRVMNCGDAGHILLSTRSANDLVQHAEWKAQLHELGEAVVKHRVRIGVVSLYNNEVGNPALPRKLRRQRIVRRRRAVVAVTASAILVVGLALGWWAWQRQTKLREQAAAEAATQRQKSVAVLPFEDLGTDQEKEAFAAGVHREVLLNLAKVADLKVISRTSVMRYKPNGERNLKQIADELGVSYVVEGTVQREAGHVRVSVELIDARTDTHAWAEKYDGDVADVLSFQSEIAQRISNQLGAKLSPREATELASPPTRDSAAFASYIQASLLMETHNAGGQREKFAEDYIRAVQLLEQAVARDPQFAIAYSALAEANTQLFFATDSDKPKYRARAEAALKEAQRLAPEAGETLLAQARLIYYGDRDFPKALATMEQAAASLPNDAQVTLTRALLYRRFGRWQESYAQFVRTTELNPQDWFAYANGGMAAVALRWWAECEQLSDRLARRVPRLAPRVRIEQAIVRRTRGDVETGNKELENLHPDLESHFVDLFEVAFWDRNYKEARRLIDQVVTYPESEQDRWKAEVRLAYVTKTLIDRETALAVEKQLEERLHDHPAEEAQLTGTLSCIKLLLGKNEEAIRLCEQLMQKHPVSEDAFDNVMHLRWLADLYVFTGDHERALEVFAKLVRVPGGTWYGELKYDPLLDELRTDPRFEPIVRQSQQPFPRI